MCIKDHKRKRSLVAMPCTCALCLLRIPFLLHKMFTQDDQSISDGTHPCVPTPRLPDKGYALFPSESHGFQLVFRENAALQRTLPSLFNSIIEKCETEAVLRAVERALEIFTLYLATLTASYIMESRLPRAACRNFSVVILHIYQTPKIYNYKEPLAGDVNS